MARARGLGAAGWFYGPEGFGSSTPAQVEAATPNAALNVKPLFMGDNGRITCADLKCAGMTAHFSEMTLDLSGGDMERVTLGHVREFAGMGITPKCEGCGAEASVLA